MKVFDELLLALLSDILSLTEEDRRLDEPGQVLLAELVIDVLLDLLSRLAELSEDDDLRGWFPLWRHEERAEYLAQLLQLGMVLFVVQHGDDFAVFRRGLDVAEQFALVKARFFVAFLPLRVV